MHDDGTGEIIVDTHGQCSAGSPSIIVWPIALSATRDVKDDDFDDHVFLLHHVKRATGVCKAAGAVPASLAARDRSEDPRSVGQAPKLPAALPWPKDRRLLALCEALYLDPSDGRNAEEWAKELGMSSRTLTRRFEAELGLTLRSWKRRLRLFRAIEILGGGLSVTTTAMELGYGSASAFIFAFRSELGYSPHAYMSQRTSSPSSR